MGLSELPDVSGVEHKRVFERLGWVTRRNGEHIILTHPDSFGVHLSIPNHKIVKRPTLHKLVRQAGLTDKEYRRLFDSL